MTDAEGGDDRQASDSAAASFRSADLSNRIKERIYPVNQTVHIVDDDPAAVVTLVAILNGRGISSVDHKSALGFLKNYALNSSGCLVLAVNTPGMSGLDLLRKLGASDICLPVIMTTGIPDVGVAVQAMKLGAIDVIDKPFEPDLILATVRAALTLDFQRNGQRVSTLLMPKRLEALTGRERNIFEMAIRGFTTKEIARACDISPRTVDAHRASILKKLKVRRLIDLFATNSLSREPDLQVLAQARFRRQPGG